MKPAWAVLVGALPALALWWFWLHTARRVLRARITPRVDLLPEEYEDSEVATMRRAREEMDAEDAALADLERQKLASAIVDEIERRGTPYR